MMRTFILFSLTLPLLKFRTNKMFGKEMNLFLQEIEKKTIAYLL